MSDAFVTSAGNATGFYGKLPAAGDFVTRTLPGAFVAPWDDWLQRSLLASRAQLGERWTAIYLESPLWRFALQPNICGPSAWTGVLMPSVDRAGRYFPLTLAAPIDGAASVLLTMTNAERWYADLEQVALATLEPGATVCALVTALAQLPLLPVPAIPVGRNDWTIAQDLSRWWTQADAAFSANLAAPHALTAVAEFAAVHLMEAQRRRHTLWWTCNTAGMPATLRAWKGLPVEQDFALLLRDPREQPRL